MPPAPLDGISPPQRAWPRRAGTDRDAHRAGAICSVDRADADPLRKICPQGVCRAREQGIGWAPTNSAAMFSARVLYGARISMLVGISVVTGAGLLGLALGAVSGYFGGWLDRIINGVLVNAFLSFPGILLAIAFAAFFGPGLDKVVLALVITGWAGYARLARAQVLKVKEMDYVTRRALPRRIAQCAFCCATFCQTQFSPC